MLLVIKVNLMLDEISFNIPFNFTILRPFHLFLRRPIWLRNLAYSPVKDVSRVIPDVRLCMIS